MKLLKPLLIISLVFTSLLSSCDFFYSKFKKSPINKTNNEIIGEWALAEAYDKNLNDSITLKFYKDKTGIQKRISKYGIEIESFSYKINSKYDNKLLTLVFSRKYKLFLYLNKYTMRLINDWNYTDNFSNYNRLYNYEGKFLRIIKK